MTKTKRKCSNCRKAGHTKNTCKQPAKQESGAYHLEVSVNDTEYKATAIDLKQALTDYVKSPDFPYSVKTRVFIKFGEGEELKRKTYNVVMARRLFKRITFKESALEILANKLNG